MDKEYGFPVLKCGCGRKLPDKRAVVAGMKGSVAMGCCPNPKCGIAYRLVESEEKPPDTKD